MQARGDGDSRSSVLLIYVQMLSLWYAAVRYDQQLREAFKKHRNALRLTATRDPAFSGSSTGAAAYNLQLKSYELQATSYKLELSSRAARRAPASPPRYNW